MIFTAALFVTSKTETLKTAKYKEMIKYVVSI